MFESLYISKSKIRRDLLALFFSSPSEKYYLRQLQRILGYSAGNIRRELLKFQKDGLFITDRVGNLLYYSLNTNHPLFEELKSIVFKTVGIEGAIKQILLQFEQIEYAFIYGSFATKSEKAGSDVDLMIIGNPDTSALNEKIAELEGKVNRQINITLYSSSEYKKRKKSKSGFIMELLRNPKIMLIGKKSDL
jgi:predicted nucleotidyltransferase